MLGLAHLGAQHRDIERAATQIEEGLLQDVGIDP
mgnify:CR=1 FL=1